jgi:ABC-type uncharacterized transport system permease subunit
MYIFVSGFLVLDAIVMTVFANNMWWFPVYVNRGDLDYYLTKPVATLFFMSLREFSSNSFMNLIMSMGIFTWSIMNYSQPIEWWKIAIYIVFIFNGATLYYMFNMMFYLPVFWTGSPRGFGALYWTMVHSMERPDRVYTSWVRALFVYIIPFVIMISYPARLVFRTVGLEYLCSYHIDIISLLAGVSLFLEPRSEGLFFSFFLRYLLNSC